MKQLLLAICLLTTVSAASAQTYISLVPSLTNTAGMLQDKANISFEVGKQWDVFSVGLDIGKTNLSRVVGRDTSVYMELRPNLNIFQQGKFTNTFTPGIGFIFGAEENLVTELTSGIEYEYNKLIHFNVFVGQYYYSGRYTASTVTFFGVSVMKYFSPARINSVFKNQQPKS